MGSNNQIKFDIVEEEEKEATIIPGWEQVEKYLEEKTVSGLIVALIEADKLLAAVLKKQGYPGKSIEERIKRARDKFNNLNGLLEGRRLLKRILKSQGGNITSLDIEDAVLAYKQSLLDLQSKEKSSLGFFERFIILLDYYLPAKWKLAKKFFLYLLLSLIIIWFLANTNLGNLIVWGVVQAVNIIFSWILAIILLCIAIIIIIIASLIYFERRKRRLIR